MGKKNETNSTNELKQHLVALVKEGPMIPGSIKKQWNVCGMPGCRCKNEKKPQKHGPYYQLSFTLAGKSTSMFIKDAEYEQMRSANDRYRKFKALSLELVQAYVRKEREDRKNRSRH